VTARTGVEGPRLGPVGLAVAITIPMVVATFLPFAIGALGPALVADVAISNTQLGLLITAFYATGALLSPSGGSLVDRIGGRDALLGLLAASGTALVLLPFAPRYVWMLAATAIGGLAIALSNPATNLLVARLGAPGSRGVLIGIKQSGVPLGSFLAAGLLPLLAAWLGWRIALTSGLLLVATGVAAVVTLLPRHTAPMRPPAAGAAHQAALAAPVTRPTSAGHSGTSWWLAVYELFTGAGLSTVTAHLALYGHQGLGLSEVTAGHLLALVAAVGVVARVLWGRIAEHHPSLPSLLAVVGGIAAAATVLVLLAEDAGAALAWVGAVGLGATAIASNAIVMTALVRGGGSSRTGRDSGFVLGGFYIGLLSGAPVFGLLVDRLGSYALGWGLTAASFALSAAVALGWRRYEAP
jgi:predicted MFS family arabinose efflux permease